MVTEGNGSDETNVQSAVSLVAFDMSVEKIAERTQQKFLNKRMFPVRTQEEAE
jgi:hypothetical protein